MTRKLIGTVALAALTAAILTPPPVAAAETLLRASSALAKNREMTESYIKFFLNEITKRSGGTLNAKFVGGPEVTPPTKQAGALKRGNFDVTHSPASYYAGTLPATYAILVTNMSPDELRKSGGWALLDAAHRKTLNATIVGWGESRGAYNTYLTKKPVVNADGSVNLKGFKMRSTATYRPLFEFLGATPIAMKSSEIFTGLQRGVIDGFGSPDAGIVRLGVKGLVKFQINPSFYRMNNLIMVNLDKWKSLTEAQRKIITDVGHYYEAESTKYWIRLAKKDEDEMKAAGMEIVSLTGKPADDYVAAANNAVWKRFTKLVGDKTAAEYRVKFVK